jgi:hypothetical protein
LRGASLIDEAARLPVAPASVDSRRCVKRVRAFQPVLRIAERRFLTAPPPNSNLNFGSPLLPREILIEDLNSPTFDKLPDRELAPTD